MGNIDLIEGGYWVRCFKPGCLYSCRETYEFSRHFREYHNEPRARRGNDGYLESLLVIPAAEGPANRARWNAGEKAMAPTVTVRLPEYRAAWRVDRRTTLASLLTAKRQASNQQPGMPASNATVTTLLGPTTTPSISLPGVMTMQSPVTQTVPRASQASIMSDNFLVKIAVEYNDYEMISNLETRFKAAIATRVRANQLDAIEPAALSLSITAMDATDTGSQLTMWYFMYEERTFARVVHHLTEESSIIASLKIAFGWRSANHTETKASIVQNLGYLRDMPAGHVDVRGLESGDADLPAGFEVDELVSSMERPS